MPGQARVSTEECQQTEIQALDANKHTVRPIPQSFLDAIANPQEFGQNLNY
ncbi:hypothetical protein [Sphingobacterium phlebotomi]|uniref:hypothetical protein n=1 Tax=Sphingobacterium phlebotomi TaxID=2605433 RepID=UPI00165373C2|nr:hypothetical protein [Sphingobacterium phlebotomi]